MTQMTRRGFLRAGSLVVAATAASPLLVSAANQIVQPKRYWDMGAAWQAHQVHYDLAVYPFDETVMTIWVRECLNNCVKAGLILDYRASESFIPREVEIKALLAKPPEYMVFRPVVGG